jgi:hypothetical protein
MAAAETAVRAEDWNAALRNLDAAALKTALTALDKKTIADLRGFVYLKLHRLKDAQTAYENAIVGLSWSGRLS